MQGYAFSVLTVKPSPDSPRAAEIRAECRGRQTDGCCFSAAQAARVFHLPTAGLKVRVRCRMTLALAGWTSVMIRATLLKHLNCACSSSTSEPTRSCPSLGRVRCRAMCAVSRQSSRDLTHLVPQRLEQSAAADRRTLFLCGSSSRFDSSSSSKIESARQSPHDLGTGWLDKCDDPRHVAQIFTLCMFLTYLWVNSILSFSKLCQMQSYVDSVLTAKL